MRRIELLINDIRFNTNNEDSNRYTDIRMVKYFNDGQRTLQSLIHDEDSGGKFFVKEAFVDLVKKQESYNLPSDLFTRNSVNGMARAVTQEALDYYTPMRQLTEKERRKEFGYILQDSTFLISPLPDVLLSNGVRINYVYRLPTLSLRVGKIKTVNANVDLRLESGFLTDDITSYADYYCVVGADGTIKDSGLPLDGYNVNNGKITTGTTPTVGGVGDYVVFGKDATTHSKLPDVCEQMLTNFVERKIQAVDSSSELTDIDYLHQEEKDQIKSLFKDVEHDVKYPPIADDTYLNF